MRTTDSAFSDPEICSALLRRIHTELNFPMRFMELCGTHTAAVYRNGLHSLLPRTLTHISGPGCPVCVTHGREIAACLELAGKDGVITACFGDMMRIPGPGGMTLAKAGAEGASAVVVYSPLDALRLAEAHPDRTVVFLGVGFETTAPATAATVLRAAAQGMDNFALFSMHKLIPPALEALLAEEDAGGIDAFLLPGHVSVVIGTAPYRFIAEKYGKPGVVGGFEPADILLALLALAGMRREGRAEIRNCYGRAVDADGNLRARALISSVFEPADALWRGLGSIPRSGLILRGEYERFDARARFAPDLPDVPENPACRCGDVLRGRIAPRNCPLFGNRCSPANPTGPCMVSAEGSCAAAFRYGA
ncbi:MAG: hydrogenase formation protein HypD [Desulfovibrio sp.]|jgi:hydrogenase expression/formation protein HypD|nr:hydrogenase formation protein HypD [Desulfovibrio sp.]